ncbi:MAG: hypothetical protein ACRC46_12135 [Thermoguttaceae bacterium]
MVLTATHEDFVVVPDSLAQDTDDGVVNSPEIDAISVDFVRDWKVLVSQTNWEKGRLIFEWRQRLTAEGCPRGAYSDEAWAQRVGTVSSQHVGRLRRVYERFGSAVSQYPRLFWSHFQIALDWDDAEMWLEGAVQNDWSVAQMRVQRWEAMGAPPHMKPNDGDVYAGEIDEEIVRRRDALAAADQTVQAKTKKVTRTDDADVPFEPNNSGTGTANESTGSTGEVLASLRDMAPFPADLQEAFERLQVAILNHKAAKFHDVDPQRIASALDSLKQILFTRDHS